MTGGHSFLGIFDLGVIKKGGHPFLRHRTASDGKLGKGLETRLRYLTVKGYCVVLDSAIHSITGMTFLTRPSLIPSPPW